VGAVRRARSGRSAVAVALAIAALAVPARAADEPLVVRTAVPPTVTFGDPTEMRVTVVARRAAVDVRSIRVTEPLAPFTQLGPTRVSRTTHGDSEIVSYDVSTACLDQRCVTSSGPRVLRLPPVRVSATATEGAAVTASTRWPELTVRGRVPAGVVASAATFHTELDPPPVSYRVSPDLLSTLLLLTALGLAVLAVGLATVRTVRLVRRRREIPMTELERALALARAAERRSPSDRRRALGLLARILGSREPHLAGQASTLAWSRPEPTSHSVSTLVEDVDRTVGGR
jgi:hypothetical protein